MSTKEQITRPDSSDKSSAPRVDGLEQPLQREASAMRPSGRRSSEPRRAGLLQLQRTIGNRSLGRLLAPPAPAIQRIAGNPATGIKEGQYGTVAAGQSITYTKLAAGCMAITAYFSDGGGSGYHFAMMMDNATQWTEFLTQVSGKTLSKLLVDSDMVGEKEGWWVRYNLIDADMFDYGDPITTSGPMSYAALKASLNTDDAIFNAGWVFDKKQISAWFKAALGIAPTMTVTQSPGPYAF